MGSRLVDGVDRHWAVGSMRPEQKEYGGGMQMVSVEELIRALRDYSAGRIDEQEAHQLAERALAEAETAMDIWLFDHVRTVAKGYATNQGGVCDATKQKIG